MKVKKKYIIGAVLVLAAAVAGTKFVLAKNSKNAAVPVSAGVVEKKDIEEMLSLKAPLEGTESIDVVSKLHYEITEVSVKEGDKVEAGQVIALLDTSELEKDIEKLQDNVRLLQIQQGETAGKENSDVALAQTRLNETLKNSQKEYDDALAELETAKRDYNSIKTLYENGAESKNNFEDAKNKLDMAQRKADSFTTENGKVVADKAQLEEIENIRKSNNNASAAQNIAIAKKELERKREELEDCKIKSSISGTVTRVNAKVGRFADEVGSSDNMPLFEIENIDTLKMNAQVSEYSIGKIKVGQKVSVSADITNGQSANAVVASISPTGEEKSGTNERFIPIEIDIKGDKKGLMAGINANAKVLVEKAENTTVVPIEALYDNGDDTYSIFKINDDNTVSVIPVETGVESITETEVKSADLKEGDKIVLNPDDSITEGMSVIINE